MLKIKDEVDLKELEKFGFVKYRYSYESFDVNKINLVSVFITDRKIAINEWHIDDVINLLFDLIQAGLVEKV